MNAACAAILCLLAGAPAHADEAFVGYGLGVFNSADEWIGQVKVGEVGYRHFLFDGVYWQNKAGYWGEGSNDKTRRASAWVSSGVGMELDLQPFEMRSGYGLAAISHPDSQLGSRFPQFNGELYVGLRDKEGDGVGFQYEHISCASFCSPNQGRDFVILQLSQKW